MKKRLLTLGCKGIRRDVSRIADLNKIRKQLKAKIKSGIPLQFDEQQEYDKTVEELALLGSGSPLRPKVCWLWRIMYASVNDA